MPQLLNCDAEWTSETPNGKLGVVCRDSMGNFKGGCFRMLENVSSALVADALAVREAMTFAMSRGWHDIEIESDSNILV
ncbi:hypothetical protein LIER_25443 [Lithospermum erythrorhizon]|uniref:RNase H type-1 domain-containing protein n=1 Tax=Lithospermum erythrorhizon TaxID=34254 RepID=A0AAV3R7Z7_LITER